MVKKGRSLYQTLLSLYPSSHFKLRGCLIISVLSVYLTVICFSVNAAGCSLNDYITMEFEFYNYESILSKLTEVGYSVCMLYEEQ